MSATKVGGKVGANVYEIAALHGGGKVRIEVVGTCWGGGWQRIGAKTAVAKALKSLGLPVCGAGEYSAKDDECWVELDDFTACGSASYVCFCSRVVDGKPAAKKLSAKTIKLIGVILDAHEEGCRSEAIARRLEADGQVPYGNTSLGKRIGAW